MKIHSLSTHPYADGVVLCGQSPSFVKSPCKHFFILFFVFVFSTVCFPEKEESGDDLRLLIFLWNEDVKCFIITNVEQQIILSAYIIFVMVCMCVVQVLLMLCGLNLFTQSHYGDKQQVPKIYFIEFQGEVCVCVCVCVTSASNYCLSSSNQMLITNNTLVKNVYIRWVQCSIF